LVRDGYFSGSVGDDLLAGADADRRQGPLAAFAQSRSPIAGAELVIASFPASATRAWRSYSAARERIEFLGDVERHGLDPDG